MKTPISRLLAIIAVAAPGQVWAADVGRVLLAAGDTVAVRDQQVVKLAFGSAIQDKDLLRTSSASNLQVRLIDESILSMRENSELRIDEFRFTGKEDGTERAFFSLLKGGLRKITGLVGRSNHKNYQMNSTTATIGIRGTHYLARLCRQDCRNPDGTPAKDGLYGLPIAASSTSRNSVTNETGEHIFGIGQPYYVLDSKTTPQLLMEAPALLSVAVRGKTVKPGAGTGTERAGDASGAQAESRAGTLPQPAPQLEFVSTNDLGPGGTPAVVAGRIPDMGNGGVAYFPGGVDSTGFQLENAMLSVNSQGQLTAFSAGPTSGQLGAGTVIDAGSNAAAGNLNWGTWTSAMVSTGSGVVSGILTYIVGDVPTLPGAGVFRYNPVGGTQPINAAGMTGAFLGGTVSVDFLQRSLQLNSWQIAFNGATYSQSSAGGTSFASSPGFGGTINWSCAGASCGTPAVPGSFAGSFTGAGAPGMGIVYRAADTSGPNKDIIGAQGFKR
jgi:hypothetical protein